MNSETITKLRSRISYILSLIGIISIGLGCSSQKTEQLSKPNILFIVVDDLRPELNSYGTSQVKSPHIDKLAEQSTVFKNNYANIPICMPSRISFLTGIHSLSNTFDIDYKRADLSLSKYETLPGFLKKNGYYTISNGKIFHTKEDSDSASWSEPAWRPKMRTLDYLDKISEKYQRYSSYEYFDKSEKKTKKVEGFRGPFIEFPDVPDNAYPDGKILDKTIKDLERLRKKDTPFFLAVGFNKPHLPFYAPKKYWDLYNTEAIQLANNRYAPKKAPKKLIASKELKNLYHHRGLEYNSDEFHKKALHGYYASISYIDKLIGDLINKVSQLKLDKNTIIVLIGDHGFHLGEHNMWGKHNTLSNALRTPLLIKIPGKVAKQENKLTSLIDVYPTICALAGLPTPNHLQGKDLFLKEEEGFQKKGNVFAKWKDQDVVITDRYLYAEWKDADGKIADRLLFDHRIDKDENNNVAHKKAYNTTIKKLSTLIKNKKQQLDN